jgi:site-specific recombinase XerD
VHDAVRDQLLTEIGADRLDSLRQVVDDATFSAVLHWLSGAARSSVDTKRRYTEDITAFARWAAEHFGVAPVPFLEILDFDSVTVWTVYARSRGMAARSQRRVLTAVSSLFGDAAPRGWSRANPVSYRHHAPAVGTSTTGRPAGATRVLEPGDTAKMHTAAATPEERLVFALLYELALRESEVVKLLTENVDRTTAPPVLNFERKRGQWRQRRLTPDLQQHLDQVLAGRTTGTVLLDPKTGGPRGRHQIIDITRRLARHAGLPHPNSVTPHVLRASAITDLLNAGEPLQEVQKWADHAHATTTQGYWERSSGLQRDSALTATLAARLEKAAAGL